MANDSGESSQGVPGPRRRHWRRPRLATLLAVLAVALFAAWGIGTPLIGQATSAPTGTMVQSGPYPQAGFNESVGGNGLLYDTYTSAIPGTIVFKKALQNGQFGGWDPYNDAGGVLGSVPNDALLSPLTVPYYVLPTWMGPAYTELLIIICGVGGSFLFLRRLGLSRVAGVIGGLTFVGSGFMVMWVDFPQSRTAAFIPALFWTVERFLQTRRVRDAVLISIPIASMLLGGFPAVTGYAGLTASVYVLARLIAMHRDNLRRLLLTALGYAGGVVGGVGLVAFQLLPFVGFMKTWVIIGRSQTSDQHLDGDDAADPRRALGLGTGNTESNYFYLSPNAIESIDYIGAVALVLALVAARCPGVRGRCCRARCGPSSPSSSAVWLVLIYVGGAPLALLQNTPVIRAIFGQNFIGRSRSILGFLLAVLVAIGYDVLTRRREAAAESGCRIRDPAPVAQALARIHRPGHARHLPRRPRHRLLGREARRSERDRP